MLGLCIIGAVALLAVFFVVFYAIATISKD